MAKAATAEKSGVTKPPRGNVGYEEPGMSKQELKHVLKQARDEPVSVAFALSDGKAIIVMDRRRPPRTLDKELKESAPDCKNARFGTAAVEPKAKLVRFTVNRACEGMARKLIVALKGTGFSKVEINSEDGAPPEKHEEMDETPEVGDGGAPGAAHGTAGTTDGDASKTAAGRPERIEAAPHAAPEPTKAEPDKPDTGQLLAKLTPLVRQMLTVVQANPSQKAALQKLASEAQTSLRQAMLSLKPADLQRTASEIDAFERAVQAAAKAAPHAEAAKTEAAPKSHAEPTPQHVTATLTGLAKRAMPIMQSDPGRAGPIKEHLAKAHAALKSGDLAAATKYSRLLQQLIDEFHGTLAKAGITNAHGNVDLGHLYTAAAKKWDGIVRTAEADIQGVRDHFAKAFANHGAGPKITQHFDESVSEARKGLWNGLSEALHDLGTAAEEKREKLLQGAKTLVRGQIEHIRSHPLLSAIDLNPVMPVTVKAVLHAGLTELDELLSRRKSGEK